MFRLLVVAAHLALARGARPSVRIDSEDPAGWETSWSSACDSTLRAARAVRSGCAGAQADRTCRDACAFGTAFGCLLQCPAACLRPSSVLSELQIGEGPSGTWTCSVCSGLET